MQKKEKEKKKKKWSLVVLRLKSWAKLILFAEVVQFLLFIITIIVINV